MNKLPFFCEPMILINLQSCSDSNGNISRAFYSIDKLEYIMIIK